MATEREAAAWLRPYVDSGRLDEVVRKIVLPYLTGEGCEETVQKILAGWEKLGPPECRWVFRLLWAYHETLQEAKYLHESAAANARPDFLRRREELACRAVGAAALLAAQGALPEARETFAGIAAELAGVFAKMFTERAE